MFLLISIGSLISRIAKHSSTFRAMWSARPMSSSSWDVSVSSENSPSSFRHAVSLRDPWFWNPLDSRSLIEQDLEIVCKCPNAPELQRAGATLDGMNGPEGFLDHIVRLSALLQRRQLDFKTFQKLFAFLEIDVPELIEFQHQPHAALGASIGQTRPTAAINFSGSNGLVTQPVAP